MATRRRSCGFAPGRVGEPTRFGHVLGGGTIDSNGAKKDVIQSSVDAVQQLRSTGVGEGGEMEYIGVVKIRYPRRGQVTTICKSFMIVCFYSIQ